MISLPSRLRVMAESAYFGVYCRRWGVPLIDGGTVRLPRLVGQGKALEISFDPKYVLDMLRVLEPDAELSLDLADGTSPALFRSGPSYSYIVMPLS